jgi:C4-type Zn-finger protein
MSKTIINMKAEYEQPPIRHLSIQCPSCKNWFKAEDILDTSVAYESELYYADLCCPKCEFETTVSYCEYSIKECESSKEVYENVLRKKESWE